MNRLGLSKLTIDLTSSVVGAVGLGVPLLLGWLSDRLPRRWVLIGTFLLPGASLIVLALARAPWQFYTFAALFAFVGVAFGLRAPRGAANAATREQY